MKTLVVIVLVLALAVPVFAHEVIYDNQVGAIAPSYNTQGTPVNWRDAIEYWVQNTNTYLAPNQVSITSTFYVPGGKVSGGTMPPHIIVIYQIVSP